MVAERHGDGHELAQELIRLDQQCAHLNTEREAMRIAVATHGQELEITAKLFRSRIGGLTPERRAKMRLAGNEDRPSFNQKQAENMILPTREPATRGLTASESGPQT